MNKKIIILISLVLIVVVPLIYFIFQPRLTDNSTITSDGYYVQKGYEKVAKIIKPAIEGYVKQDSQESAEQRKKRLSTDFPADSPVYDNSTEYLSPQVKRASGKLSAVYAEMLEGEAVLYAVLRVTIYYKDGNTINTNNTFWVNVTKDKAGNYNKVNDLGVWQ